MRKLIILLIAYYLHQTICILIYYSQNRLDNDNNFLFLTIIKAKLLYDEGIKLKHVKQYEKAIEQFEISYQLNSNVAITSEQIVSCYILLNDSKRATSWFYKTIKTFSELITSSVFINNDVSIIYLNYIKFLYNYGLYSYVINLADELINHIENHNINIHIDEMFYFIGLCHQNNGNIILANEYYIKCININDNHIGAKLNQATLFQSNGNFDIAILIYKQIINYVKFDIKSTKMIDGNTSKAFDLLIEIPVESDLLYYLMTIINLSMSYIQNQNFIIANEFIRFHLNKLLNLSNQICNNELVIITSDINYCLTVIKYIRLMNNNYIILKRAVKDWNEWEILTYNSVKNTLDLINYNMKEYDGCLLPFDTLLLPVSLSDKLVIAKAYSNMYLTQPKNPIVISTNTMNINIGLVSYDFNSHPTAYLIIGFYEIIKNSKHSSNISVNLYTYNYGKDDNSTIRSEIYQLSDKFYDLANHSNSEINEIIRNDQIDILLDMQVYTYNSRVKIFDNKPANILVNYLVYPGSSGSNIHDLIVADKIVIPPEHARYYSESLLLLPSTYQISYYESTNYPIDQSSNKINKRIIFCNFNKIDKIDPITMHTWMNILTSTPGSHLWLLGVSQPSINNYSYNQTEYSSLLSNNIRSTAKYYGISSNRIVFLDRINKQDHIKRQSQADIFLDTFIYGAHSTATDALKGGLPLITLLGDAFSSRVGTSLYNSIHISKHNNQSNQRINKLISNLLIRDDIKDYENFAVYLSQHTHIVNAMKSVIASWSNEFIGLFDTNSHVNNLLRGFTAKIDLQSYIHTRDSFNNSSKKKYHLIVL